MAKEKTFLDSLRKDYGDDIMIADSSGPWPSIPTGSLALDISIGIGGIPCGRFTEVYGAEASAKTTLALSIAKQALILGKRVLYVDLENVMDLTRARELLDGYMNENIIFVQPENAEQAFEIIEKGIDDKFGFIVLDSVGAIASTVELEEDDYGKAFVGITPRLLSKFLKKTSYKVRSNGTAVLMINQVRDKVGSYIQSYETPGGHALKHYSSVIILVSKVEDIKQGTDKIGIKVKFIVKKNKVHTPFREAAFPVMFKTGVDYYLDVVQFADFLGVLKGKGTYLEFEGNILALGQQRTAEILRTNEELLDKIVKACYNMARIDYPPRRDFFDS